MKLINMMMAFLAIGLSSVVFADQPVFGFKNTTIGDSYEKVKAGDEFLCEAMDSHGYSTCRENSLGVTPTIASVSIDSARAIIFDGKLTDVRIHFSPSGFDTVSRALIVKYGPGKTTKRTIKNRMGASFLDETIAWENPTAIMKIERYSIDIDNSEFSLFYKPNIPGLLRRLHSNDMNNAKDL